MEEEPVGPDQPHGPISPEQVASTDRLAAESVAADAQGAKKTCNRWSWVPTSENKLAESERRIFEGLQSPYSQIQVKCGPSTSDEFHMNTVVLGKPENPPLVLVHGFGGSWGFWVKNLDMLAQQYRVFAVDMVGFGRSSRMPLTARLNAQYFQDSQPQLADSAAAPHLEPSASAVQKPPSEKKLRRSFGAEEAEAYFVDSLYDWSQNVDELRGRKFSIMGHSLGGFLVSGFALKHAAVVDKLFLVDPWGIPQKPDQTVDSNGQPRKMPFRWRAIRFVMGHLSPSPLSIVRGAGPWGHGLVLKYRKDFVHRFADVFPNDTRILDYIYHCAAKSPPTGELAFRALTTENAWAVNPIMHRIHDLHPSIDTLFIYGSYTWMDKEAGLLAAQKILGRAEVRIVSGGHHLYADDAAGFHAAVFGDPRIGRYQQVYANAAAAASSSIGMHSETVSATAATAAAAAGHREWASAETRQGSTNQQAATA